VRSIHRRARCVPVAAEPFPGARSGRRSQEVSVQVGAAGPDKTTVTVSTKLKFGLTGWGTLEKNINRVFDSLDQSLGS